jgi:putative peptidoglycan lipid II flippase
VRSLATALVLSVPAVLGLVGLGRLFIPVLLEHGRFDLAAGSLTYSVLVVFSVALPADVATEVISRALIALRQTRTPLLTNSLQIVARIALMSLLTSCIGIIAVPAAPAIAASVETIVLGTDLWLALRRRTQPNQPDAVALA